MTSTLHNDVGLWFGSPWSRRLRFPPSQRRFGCRSTCDTEEFIPESQYCPIRLVTRPNRSKSIAVHGVWIGASLIHQDQSYVVPEIGEPEVSQYLAETFFNSVRTANKTSGEGQILWMSREENMPVLMSEGVLEDSGMQTTLQINSYIETSTVEPPRGLS